MLRLPRALLLATALAPIFRPASAQEPDGYPVEDATTVAACSGCHAADDEGRLGRLSFLRKTPEGWQTSMRRMVALYDVDVSPEQARAIVRYLSNEHGLAPEELRPALYEVERELVEYDWDGDSGVEHTCLVCHSMGRVQTQRRTKEEWGLLLATHRALYPLVDFQAFRRPGPVDPEPGENGRPPDPRHPMDVAVDELSRLYPLDTPEWSAWAANKRSPRLEGVWALTGHQTGKGPLYGTVRVTAKADDPDAFATRASWTFPATGEASSRSGEGLVYTGYQWRGRSNPGADDELREVMFVERDQRTMHGRWFTGAYDELGMHVELVRVGPGPVVTGVHPRAVVAGPSTVTVFGHGLPAAPAGHALDFGAGVSVTSVEVLDEGSRWSVGIDVAADAALGARDLFAMGRSVEEALVVHDGADRIEITPPTGMARVGGAAFPKELEVFEAVAYDDGPDGERGTEDDLELGRVPARWSLEEYSATYDDDDVEFVGEIDPATGLFTPAVDGPNPERSGSRNNVGDVWVIGTYTNEAGEELRARAHLLVTVPLYMRFEPWREVTR